MFVMMENIIQRPVFQSMLNTNVYLHPALAVAVIPDL
jgi:hypothetical protein